ncbi:MAG: type II secretion system F family protein [candidate division WOR-3 bacterium]|nr:type II secretion system F family protein [candidate division WOR-3 bacterium]
MPIYLWKGRTPSGSIESGEIVATNPTEVHRILRERKVVPTSVRSKPKEITLPFLKGRVSSRDISVFTRQFSVMINAGLPLIKCLDIQVQQVQSEKFKEILRSLISSVEGGSTLADALRKYKDTFGDLYINMVEAGEKGGSLASILARLAEYLEKADEIKRKIRGAMIYPAMIVLVAILAVAVLLLFVIPTFSQMYAGIGSQLPGPTRIVIALSNFLKKNIVFIVGILVGLVIAVRYYYRTEQGHLQIDRFIIKVPIFGTLIKKQAISRFSRTLSTLIASGVNILDALEITSGTTGNKVVENAILRSRTSIAQGESIAEPLTKEKAIFPPMVIQMITVGEQTGGLDEMLAKVADFYDDEVDQAVENLMSALEPVVLLFLAVIIGGMVVAMYLPIFKLASQFTA